MDLNVLGPWIHQRYNRVALVDYILEITGSKSMVDGWLWMPEGAGSNPVFPTNNLIYTSVCTRASDEEV